MMFYDYYADVPEKPRTSSSTRQELGRLVTVDADGPAAHRPLSIPVPGLRHRNAPASLRRAARRPAREPANARSKWTRSTARIPVALGAPDERDVRHGLSPRRDLRMRRGNLRGSRVLAAQQQRLMQHYQPDGGYKPVSAEHAMYRGPFGTIAALTLTVRARKVKWKLAQNRDRPTTREDHRRTAQARPPHGRRRRGRAAVDARPRSDEVAAVTPSWYRVDRRCGC